MGRRIKMESIGKFVVVVAVVMMVSIVFSTISQVSHAS